MSSSALVRDSKRYDAARALERLGRNDRAHEARRTLARDELSDTVIRVFTILELGEFGGHDILPDLTQLASSDPDIQVREAALEAANRIRVRFGIKSP